VKNIESPFTELYALLKRNSLFSDDGREALSQDSENLMSLCSHIDNAIDSLLRGLQDVGQLIGLVKHDEINMAEEISRLGFFISTIGNLTEALNTLRLDADYVRNGQKHSGGE